MSQAKFARYNDSLARNTEFVYGPREAVLSYGENALFLQAMGDTVSGVTQLNYVRSLFEQEKLPFALGWRLSKVPITLTNLGAMIVQLQDASPDIVGEGGRIAA